MKYVQIIDGADNCSYSVYAVSDKAFRLIFPAPGQDIEFIDDVLQRLSPEAADARFGTIWQRGFADKRQISGIHGTLFYECDHKRKFYPNKRESDLDDSRGR